LPPKDRAAFKRIHCFLRPRCTPEQMDQNHCAPPLPSSIRSLPCSQIQTMDQASFPRAESTAQLILHHYRICHSALLLATIGVYAVIAFTVSMRAAGRMAIRIGASGSRRGENRAPRPQYGAQKWTPPSAAPQGTHRRASQSQSAQFPCWFNVSADRPNTDSPSRHSKQS